LQETIRKLVLKLHFLVLCLYHKHMVGWVSEKDISVREKNSLFSTRSKHYQISIFFKALTSAAHATSWACNLWL